MNLAGHIVLAVLAVLIAACAVAYPALRWRDRD